MALLIENRQKKIKLALQPLRKSVNKILRELGLLDKEVSLLLLDNEGIRDINRLYLNRDYPTNVIAFSQIEGEFGNINPGILGDVVISVEQAWHDAEENDLPLEDEMDFLVIHGILHLLGYEHENCNEAQVQKMKDKSEAIFFNLKGYIVE
jgi:probable rRNA maturation factor